jgi:RNA polymerase sigma-70 factor (ECF subfamily)
LALEARVALTLRTICAVPTADIARAFLVNESTMTRRLTRAKTKIAEARIPYRVPSGRSLTERLPGVLAVLYVLFTNGYNADGEPAFAEEAIRLARLLTRLLPGEAEVSALLALMLLQHSRRDARRDADGRLVNLEMQDRTRWDHAAIAEAMGLLGGSRLDGQYGLQARIAACHATAPSTEDTNWREIAQSYDSLVRIHASPVIELNRAVAHGHAYGPSAGLELLEHARSAGALDGYPLAIAAEAHLRARHGDDARAAELFRQAAERTHSESERRALLDRAAAIVTTGAEPG